MNPTDIQDSLSQRRRDLMTELLLREFSSAGDGYCLRVDFFLLEEAEAICKVMQSTAPDVSSFVLVSQDQEISGAEDWKIHPDKAIELRNRKQVQLCIFVPTAYTGSTVSSLGNAFASIDAPTLVERALRQTMKDLERDGIEAWRTVRQHLRRPFSASGDALLDFCLTISILGQHECLDELGAQLWRVGLISDLGDDYRARLARNRETVDKLTKTVRAASYDTRSRIYGINIDDKLRRQLEAFFSTRELLEVQIWSRELVEVPGPTFEQWSFHDQRNSDLSDIAVESFRNANGTVNPTSHLFQEPPSDLLWANCGSNAKMGIRWKPTPQTPRNVMRWRISLVPDSLRNGLQEGNWDEARAIEELVLSSIKERATGATRSASIRMNVTFGEDGPPSDAMCVRIVALADTGDPICNENGSVVEGYSEPFYLSALDANTIKREHRTTVPSLAFARLQAALATQAATIGTDQPAWEPGYFRIRINDRDIVRVQLSEILLELERKTLSKPNLSGRFNVELDEVRVADAREVISDPVERNGVGWAEFWKERADFFSLLVSSAPRDVLEAADWTNDALTKAALDYAQAYRKLLEALAGGSPEALRDALTVDTLRVRCAGARGTETAVVLLPTHPLRVAWFASHAALLREWEKKLLEEDRPKRRRLLDETLVRELAPANMPAFVPGDNGELYVFFQNLGFYHGVALPAGAPDPRRRFLDLALMLGLPDEPDDGDAQQPQRLARHLSEFRRLHDYADPLQVALLNPDHGDFFARSLDAFVSQQQTAQQDDDDGELPPITAFEVTAYTLDDAAADLSALDKWRAKQAGRRTRNADFLQPALATAVRPLSRLAGDDARDAHLAVVTDLSRPSVQAVAEAAAEGAPEDGRDDGPGSLSLYGLVARFTGAAVPDGEAVRWSYRILPTAPAERHPAREAFSKTLVEVQAAYLRACGRLLRPGASVVPALEVRLDREQAERLDQLHQVTDWVITVDRFFGIDYYDSPNNEALGGVAQKYLIDYTPEFVEGLGHRMVVTTAWRAEVATILRRAMLDLGFATVESSVGQVLHHLKTVSGRLALQALGRRTQGAEAVALGAVIAWLKGQGKLKRGVLVPVDAHPRLFAPSGRGPAGAGERRCDLVLFGLKRNVVEATFIEVKYRSAATGGEIEDLAADMAVQMRLTGDTVEERFFSGTERPDRVDGALQRAYLANVLRFYLDRAIRYGLIEDREARQFLGHMARLEKSGWTFSPSYEGYIVSLNGPERSEWKAGDVTVKVLIARDFERSAPDLLPANAPSGPAAARRGAPAAAPPATPDDGRTAAPLVEPAPASGAAQQEIAAPGSGADPDAGSAAMLDVDPALPDGPSEMAASADSNAGDVASDNDPLPEALGEPAATLEIIVGESGGTPIAWKPSVQGSPHLFITGIPGQGKSWTVLRLMIELARQGVPSLSFDFHGQFGAAGSPYVRLAHPAVLNAAAGLPFSPFECSAEGGIASSDATALAVAEIFGYIAGLGDIQRDTLFTCIRDAYRSSGFGASDGPPPSEYPTLDDILRRLDRAQQDGQARNVLARCRPLLEMNLFRPPVGERNDLMDVVRRGLVVDLHQIGSEKLQLAAGAFLLRKIYADMFGWGEADRIRLAIVLDEAHRLAKDVTLPKIMKEGRKFGVLVIVASQGLADFHPDVLKNVGTQIAFKATHLESNKIGAFFRGRSAAQYGGMLQGLGTGTAIVQNSEMARAAVVRMRPPE